MGHSGLEGMLEYALMKKFQPGCSHLPAVPNLASCLLPVCWALSSQGQEAPVSPSCSSGGTWGKEQGTDRSRAETLRGWSDIDCLMQEKTGLTAWVFFLIIKFV